jgi:hypothetical protein
MIAREDQGAVLAGRLLSTSFFLDHPTVSQASPA